LIVLRAIQGVAGALLVPGSLAIISASFDEARRGQAIGTWSGFTAITAGIGPVMGGWLIEHVSWRAVFWINVPLALVVLLISLRHVPESRDDDANAPLDGFWASSWSSHSTVRSIDDWPLLTYLLKRGTPWMSNAAEWPAQNSLPASTSEPGAR